MTYPPQPGRQPWPNVPPTGYGFPTGSQPYGPPPPYPYGPPARSRRVLWITLSAVAALALSVTIAGLVVLGKRSSEEAKITTAITEFGHAVDTNDWPAAATYLCAAEAKQFNESNDGTNSGAVEPGERLPINVSDITVDGDTATAQLSRPPQPARTLHLKKEDGSWKLCHPDEN